MGLYIAVEKEETIDDSGSRSDLQRNERENVELKGPPDSVGIGASFSNGCATSPASTYAGSLLGILQQTEVCLVREGKWIVFPNVQLTMRPLSLSL